MIDLTKIEDINLRSDILKQNLIEQLEEAKLPIVIIKYIMEDLTRQIGEQYYAHCTQAGLSTENKEQKQEFIQIKQEQQED